MNLNRVWRLLRKEFSLGPRNPIFLFAIIVPFGLTLIFQMAFGALFDPKPRMGIVDDGNSEVTAHFEDMEGIELLLLDDAGELKARVESDDLDAGLILPAGFDEAVRSGEQPLLELYIGGESLASNRIILSVMAVDFIRNLEVSDTSDAPVDVEVVKFGEEGLPISLRLVPIIVFYALVMAGVFLPGSSIVEEKEKGTLTALLVTPVRTKEVLAAKWVLGVILSSLMALVTLFLNRAFGPRPLEVLAVILLAAVLNAMIGLLVGVVSKNTTALFATIKGAGIFLFAPVIFYIFPEWPQWIAMIFPLYWIIEPIWQVSIMGNPLSDVWFELTIAAAITVALIPLVVLLSRRMN